MFQAHYRIHNFRFALRSHCEELKSGLAQLYPALLTSSRKGGLEWSVEKRDGSTGSFNYVTSCEGIPIFKTKDRSSLLDDLEWRITSGILDQLGHFIQMHSAGLVRGKRALLLVGPSGSGKSSLALALLLRGWKCLSDEIILIDPKSGLVMPFPRSFHIHEDTLEMMSGIRMAGGVYFDNAGKRRLDPGLFLGEWVAGPALPEWIVFPEYNPGGQGGLVRVGHTEAVTRLISQSINLVDHADRGLDVLTGLAGRIGCLKLSAGGLNEAVSLLTELTEENSSKVFFSAGVHEGVY